MRDAMTYRIEESETGGRFRTIARFADRAMANVAMTAMSQALPSSSALRLFQANGTLLNEIPAAVALSFPTASGKPVTGRPIVGIESPR